MHVLLVYSVGAGDMKANLNTSMDLVQLDDPRPKEPEVLVMNEFSMVEREARNTIMQQLGEIKDVKGDGSCFIYAVLTAIGHLHHQGTQRPSSQDLRLESYLRHRIAAWWKRHPSVLRNVEVINDASMEEVVEQIKQSPVYDGDRLMRSGGYGGLSAFMALANILKIDIIVWNQAASEEALPYILQNGDTDWVFTREWSFKKILKRMLDVSHKRFRIPIAHVQYNGRNHYRGWCARTEPVELCKAVASIAKIHELHELKLQQKCEQSGIKYEEAPCEGENERERKRRYHKLQVRCLRAKKVQKNCASNEVMTQSSQNNGPWSPTDIDKMHALDALHPNKDVRAAMIAFAEGETKHKLVTCEICLETRLQWFDTCTSMLPDDLYPERHKLYAKAWTVSKISEDENAPLACDRCKHFLKFSISKQKTNTLSVSSKKAHPYSGWLSDPQFFSDSGTHNNMHFYPTSSYLFDLTEFELSCIAKYSFATNIHIVGSSIYQKGCVAHVISEMRVVKTLPRLPSEVEVVIVCYTRRNNNNMNARLERQYGVRRKSLEVALNGLMYGVPKGGFDKCPLDDKLRYIKYEYRDHIDGTKLHGQYFEVHRHIVLHAYVYLLTYICFFHNVGFLCNKQVRNLPNPAYWDIEISTAKLQAYHPKGHLPQGLQLFHRHINDLHEHQQAEVDVNGSNDAFPEQSDAHTTTESGSIHGDDEIICILNDRDNDEKHATLYNTLVNLVGKEAAKQYARSGRGISIAKLETLPRGQVVDPWKTYGFWSGLAPRVFSAGGGDLTLATECTLSGGLTGKRSSASLWLEHVTWSNTNRFAQHPFLPILGARLLMQEQARGQASFGLRQSLGDPNLSQDEIRVRMEAGDESIFNQLFTLQGNVIGTAAYWAKFNREVKASLLDASFLEQTQMSALPPTFIFNSQSCAEYWWTPLHELLQQFSEVHACMNAKATCQEESKV